MEIDQNRRGSTGEGRLEVLHEGDVHLGTAIVHAVSEATGVAVEAMDKELNDVVDPDALNHLFADRLDGRPRAGGHVSFSLLDCDVQVFSDGRIVVTR
jgi:hypothetical protein